MAIAPFTRQLGRIERRVAAGLYQAGNRIFNRSQELVPVDTGTLKSSGRVLEPEVDLNEVTVVVGYGYGDATRDDGSHPSGYAVWVHEKTEVQHPVGQAKFLEQAANELREGIGRDVAVSIHKPFPTGEVVELLGGGD